MGVATLGGFSEGAACPASAPHASFANFGYLLKQTIHDLRRGIVSIDENRQARQPQFRHAEAP
ncbi:hypothetical protein ATY79_28550 [Rhizobium sp. R693]|nr:hypothetical protein ATY79_28550 [Rhizobium sp. R693]